MAENSRIEWTDATWNPVRGCTRVSPGCGGANHQGGCYAEKMAARFSAPGQPYHGFAERTPHGGRWTGKVALIPDALTLPLRWRKPRRIFVNSMSDLFHEALSDDDINRVFAVMALCPQHTFQVLTKRPGEMRKYVLNPWTRVHIGDRVGNISDDGDDDQDAFVNGPWPLPNVWLGVSVENRDHIGRIFDLVRTPAALRFISFEPLIGDVGHVPLAGVGWAIVGAESGPRSRPMSDDWVRNIRDQCSASGTKFMFKQRTMDGHKISLPELDGRQHTDIPYA
jgi:protein gp37